MSMTAPIANTEMAAAWDGREGDDWTDHADRYEASSQRHSAHLDLNELVAPADRVLDIGCGTGRLTLDAARVASPGAAVGIDLSSRMVAYARERARRQGVANVEFLQADAQVHPFDAGAFDIAISSFGAMFFNDPTGAFTNIHRALASGAPLVLLAWRPLEENEWLTAIRGALALGRDLPAPPPSAPGPFGLADRDRAREVLDEAGFVDITVTPVDEPILLGANHDDAWTFVVGMGIVRGLTQDLDDEAKRTALDRLRAVVEEHETPEGVLLGSAAWLIKGRRP